MNALRLIALSLCAPAILEAAPSNDRESKSFNEEDYAWWAIQPLAVQEIPDIGKSVWPKNAIDHFILEKLTQVGLEPSPEADPYEIVRRVYFDLHGLPPSPEQVHQFIEAAESNFDSAYAKLIDQLLESPRYGEYWGQHWLDVVRYADTDGYRADDYRPDVWRYRDYVIDSFNQDKPYDQFVREQLAGDEIDPENPDTVIGTAFLRLGVYEWNQRDTRMHWGLIVNEMTNVTGEAFLGLGVGCARCHDHKFDPILQKDYYALQSFMATTYWPDDQQLATPEERFQYEKEMTEWKRKAEPVQSELDILTAEVRTAKKVYTIGQFPPDIQDMYHKSDDARTPYEFQMAELIRRQVVTQDQKIQFDKEFIEHPEKLARYNELIESLKEIEKEKPASLPMAFIATDASSTPVDTVMKTRRGSLKVEPSFLEILGLPKPVIEPTQSTTGRRSALAEWIASPNNPFSTRVIVNRLWQYHFGYGIVRTPNEFGILGDKPSHPELLDWLTFQLLESDWHLKALHRSMMNSATYRQTTRREPSEIAVINDPDNRLLWRFPPKRLSAEQARDAILVLSGEMRYQTGGPSLESVDPVRSIYVKKRRNRPVEFLHSFDSPLGFDSAPQRQQTTTPIQSLLMINGEWPLQRAASFAKRLLGENRILDSSIVENAFLIAYNRLPTPTEVELALQFIRAQIKQLEQDRESADPNNKYSGSSIVPSDEHFAAAKDSVHIGDAAVRLTPESPYERLAISDFPLGDSFCLEAVVTLDAIHSDASVNTLISQWNGDHTQSGWSVGVTSSRSKYDPLNFIVQLIGENGVGNEDYEVVASGLRIPLGEPVYLAAVVTANRIKDESGGGQVVFYMKRLSKPDAELETAIVRHSIAERIHSPTARRIIGGRDANGHLWTGQIARISLSNHTLDRDALFIVSESQNADRKDWLFSMDSEGEANPARATWIQPARLNKEENPLVGAVTDFCHTLITSNEFLYLN